MKKKLKKIKRKLVERGPYGGIVKAIILFCYKLALQLFTKFDRYKKTANEVIIQYRPECETDTKKRSWYFNEILYARFMYGIIPKEYFAYGFEYLTHEGRSLYVTRGNKYFYYRRFNDKNYAEFLNKKTETYRKFGEFFNRESIGLYDENDYEKFLGFVERHPRFIYKPAQDYGGHGIKIYDSTLYDSMQELFDVMMFHGAAVVEELIVQGEEIAQFHPESVNTVRIVTYRRGDGVAIPQWCFLRMGAGDSHTDNMSAGGISARIDYETGIITDIGRDYLGNKHMYHPDSGIQLVGFNMPKWDEAKEVVQKIVNVLPEMRFVGWDLAYSTKGWVLVEGNAQPQCVAPQLTEYRGILHTYNDMYDLYLEEMGLTGTEEEED